MALREQLIAYAMKYQGEYGKIQKAIEREERWEKCEVDCDVITILDDAYPRQLHRLTDPPFVLFYIGEQRLLKERSAAIVGSRKACDYGVKCTEMIVSALKERYVIVSGMAMGIDRIAHLNATHTIAVLGCGTAYCYPLVNRDLYARLKKQQLVISEYPPFTKPLAHHFPRRNRIIAALSDCLIVAWVTMKSGTMHTVNVALDLGISVYCVPYPFASEAGAGCNWLILQGATPLITLEEVKKL